MSDKREWKEVAEEASKEQDPTKLGELVDELIDAIDHRNQKPEEAEANTK